MGREMVTVRKWRWMGVVPKPIITVKDNMNWYLADEIRIYAEVFARYGVRRGQAITEDFKAHLAEEIASLKSRILEAINEGEDPHDEVLDSRFLPDTRE
jgi:hypothetical protein